MTTLEYGLCFALLSSIGIIVNYRNTAKVHQFLSSTMLDVFEVAFKKTKDTELELSMLKDQLKASESSFESYMEEQREITKKAVIAADNFNIERDNLRFENTKLATQLKTAVDKIAELNEAIGSLEVTFDESYQEPQPRESDGRFARKVVSSRTPVKQLCDVVKDMQEEPLKVGDWIKGKHFGSETYTEGPILFFGHFTKKPNVGGNFLMLDTCRRVPRK